MKRHLLPILTSIFSLGLKRNNSINNKNNYNNSNNNLSTCGDHAAVSSPCGFPEPFRKRVARNLQLGDLAKNLKTVLSDKIILYSYVTCA